LREIPIVNQLPKKVWIDGGNINGSKRFTIISVVIQWPLRREIAKDLMKRRPEVIIERAQKRHVA